MRKYSLDWYLLALLTFVVGVATVLSIIDLIHEIVYMVRV